MASEQHTSDAGHRHERPEDWGWHAELGRTARVAGFVCALFLVLLIFATHGSRWELVWSIGFAAAIVAGLVWDRYRRRNAWRS